MQDYALKAATRVTVGVISPYINQVELLQRMVTNAGLGDSATGTVGSFRQAQEEAEAVFGAFIEVRTVDGFQVTSRLN